ncbi:MAG TPA: 2OG-Fe(II) oxygenase [Allosphingosinicella sp.]|uniref:prolyl hydroxylase family protein n=1 Tax=Allosphingosinicella sp. TaxID=2823234 RepID=UPI002EDB16E5
MAASPPNDLSADVAREPAERQFASLQQSAGWLLNALQVEADGIASQGESLESGLARLAGEVGKAEEDKRLLAFPARFSALAREREQPAAADLALRLEQAASEALSLYVESQARSAARTAELVRSLPDENDEAGRQLSLARIGAAVRGVLDRDKRAERLEAGELELYAVPDFLNADERQGLMDLIDRNAFPSGILGENADKEFRTSRSCNMELREPLVSLIDRRLSAALGISRRFSETMQGQRYEVGQQFKPHHDFFHKGEGYYDYAQRQGGQRTWTAMLFLNAPEAGGCTNFPEAGVRVAPEPGKLLIWNNMKRDGSPNAQSLHQGEPVEAGTKYVITKWFRERPWA